MPRRRFPLVRLVASVAVLLALLLVLPRLGRDDSGDGEVWRRGLTGGEQVRLQPAGRYEIQRWSWFGADETIESGTWVQLGEVVSLVPSTPGRPTRLLRKEVRDAAWHLIDPTQPDRDSRYERVD